MARIVMKFGGTSVEDLGRIANVASRVQKEVNKGNQVCVVVSAMSDMTSRLVGYVQQSSPAYDPVEYDIVVSAGEQITAGLLALKLQELNTPARSWLGWQAGIYTSNSHSRARIEEIVGSKLIESMQSGVVAVVAGFQGVHAKTMRITTLGRGGSDTSAVALAVGVKADRCDIYTDVDGVYTADPRVVPNAQKLDTISHEEMLELASLGSKVLQTRSVEIAMNHKMPLQVLSSFEELPGTLITSENSEEDDMEREVVVGVTAVTEEAQIIVSGIKDSPGIVASIFEPISKAEINVDMIIQTTSSDGSTTDITFTVPAIDADQVVAVLEASKDSIKFKNLCADKNIAKVSVVGIGMRSHTGVAQAMFRSLAEKGINIKDISTSEIKISVLIEKDYVELALRSLHTAYGLDK